MPDTITLSKKNYLDLADGRFVSPPTPRSTNAADVKALVNAYAQAASTKKLVLYFHGGLDKEQVGFEIAQDLYPLFSGAGGYPVFFIWQSGITEVLTHNLREIFDERIFKQLLEKVTQFAVGKLTQTEGERGVGTFSIPSKFDVQDELRQPAGPEPYGTLDPSRLPADTELTDAERAQFEAAVQRDPVIKMEAEAIADSGPAPESGPLGEETRGLVPERLSRHTLMSPEAVEGIKADAGAPGERGLFTPFFLVKAAGTILARVISRFAKRRDHGVYVTVVEEILRELYLARIGADFWRLTKKDTADAFGAGADCGGSVFLRELKAKRDQDPNFKPRIVLIGHSTGAVYICNFLKAAKAVLPDLTYEIIFLAAACTFTLLADTLRECEGQIKGIRMFAMHDSVEKQDQLVPLAYPRSLLYLVSGLGEDEVDAPLVGMERFYSRQAPFGTPDIRYVMDYLAQDPHCAVWSKVAGIDGLSSESVHHGDFDNDKVTRASMKYIIENGL